MSICWDDNCHWVASQGQSVGLEDLQNLLQLGHSMPSHGKHSAERGPKIQLLTSDCSQQQGQTGAVHCCQRVSWDFVKKKSGLWINFNEYLFLTTSAYMFTVTLNSSYPTSVASYSHQICFLGCCQRYHNKPNFPS